MKELNVEIKLNKEELKKKLGICDGRDGKDGKDGKDGEKGEDGKSADLKEVDERFDSLKKDIFEELEKKAKKGGGVLPNIFIGNYIVHEVHNVDSSTTSVTLNYTIAGQGNAIFGARYQGQTLDKDVHYTVAVNIITPLVTFEDSTQFSITYVRE